MNNGLFIMIKIAFLKFMQKQMLVLLAFYFILQILPAQNQEPILGRLIRELQSNDAQPNGQFGIYQILSLKLKDAQLYQAVELELAYLEQNGQPVSLMIYNQAELVTKKTENVQFQGRRLLTRGLAGKSQFRFDLISPANKALSSDSNVNNLGQNILLEVKDFPIYIVLYPFQSNAENVSNYQYRVRFVKKNFGMVRFRLLRPQKANKSNYFENPNLHFSMEIDNRHYNWVFDRNHKNSSGRADTAFYSKAYQIVGLGSHSIQVSSQNYYARAQFTIEVGKTKLVDLQLQERESKLVLLVPEKAMLLLDGIPLKRQSKQRWTPAWENVVIEKQNNHNYEQSRLEYSVTVPAGKHHLLIQYEGNTWQRELYLQEGDEQYFQLSWELRDKKGNYRAQR